MTTKNIFMLSKIHINFKLENKKFQVKINKF